MATARDINRIKKVRDMIDKHKYPETIEEARQAIDDLNEAATALQSMDDLGSRELNSAAMMAIAVANNMIEILRETWGIK